MEAAAARSVAATSWTATEIPLATSVDGLMLVADPLQTRARAAGDRHSPGSLARRLNVEYADAFEALGRPGKRFAYLARRVPSTLALDVLAQAPRSAATRGSTCGSTHCATTRPTRWAPT